MSRCEISPQEAGGDNVCAFLDAIAWSEGTDNGKQPTKDRGYDVLVGGGNFTGYADHPQQLIYLPKLKISSTAAGRYQLLAKYCHAYQFQLGLKDFSPLSQDKIALQQIRERKAIPMIQAGDFAKAVKACSNIWASFPAAGYGQHEHTIDSLIAAYQKSGGALA